MAQVNQLPRGTAYLFLRTFPPLEATELEVQDWIRIWYRGSEYQQPNHHLHHDFTIWILGISRVHLTGGTLRELTPRGIKANLLGGVGSQTVTDLILKDILMARELEMENVRERVSTTEDCYQDDSEANVILVNRNEFYS